MVRLSKARGIYCTQESWERIRRRGRKAGMDISSLGVLCCKQAAEREAVPPPAPVGRPLVLSAEGQRRLRMDIEAHERSCRIEVGGAGGAKMTLWLDEALAILRMCDCGDDV